MKRRSIALMVIFTFITFGIYAFVWTVMFQAELKRTTGDGAGVGLHILLMLFTFGIYALYWHYAASVRLIKAGARDVSPLANLLLAIFTFTFIPMLLKQMSANHIAN
ncbi:MAG: DUF4234 domain-containing protein [Defluviitaleaceae bacterium]|nr:DUF4234 domain-containing protein [Defluviitaleaceae bacterium]